MALVGEEKDDGGHWSNDFLVAFLRGQEETSGWGEQAKSWKAAVYLKENH